MSEGKSINLLRAAKELNIGLSTAVEFLGKKGYKVDPKPNTKLDEQMKAFEQWQDWLNGKRGINK